MAAVDELFRSGDLSGARAALVDEVKRAPSDQGARIFLFQLLALAGEWDKALNQLKALAQLSPEAQMLSTVYGQAIAAERRRADAWAGRQPFEVLAPSSPWVEQLGQSLNAMTSGRRHEGERLRDEAFDQAGDTPGRRGNDNFLWIADIDPRLGPCFEAIVAGRWGLVPFEAVEVVRAEGARDLRDMVWLPVEMRLRSGQSAAALLPVRYPQSEIETEDAVRLGRETRWIEGPHGEVPVGQRVWTFDDGSETGLLAVERLDFV